MIALGRSFQEIADQAREERQRRQGDFSGSRAVGYSYVELRHSQEPRLGSAGPVAVQIVE